MLEHGYAHHIERLMVLGNAMCLLRTDPDAAYEWFMEMFVDAYDWVMVPNVYAMSQFAAGRGDHHEALRVRLELPPQDVRPAAGEWTADWDALYWTFVRDHHDVFAAQPALTDDRDPVRRHGRPPRRPPTPAGPPAWLALMLHALELLPDDAGQAAVRRDWQALRDAGLPSQLDHSGTSNAPHLTVLAAPDRRSGGRARGGAVGPLLPVEVRASGLLLFGSTGSRSPGRSTCRTRSSPPCSHSGRSRRTCRTRDGCRTSAWPAGSTGTMRNVPWTSSVRTMSCSG